MYSFDCNGKFESHFSKILFLISINGMWLQPQPPLCRSIGIVRKYLTSEVAAQLIHSFVTTRFDYCNSLLNGLPSKSLKSVQKVQNTAGRILALSHKYEHITLILKQIHWLPVHLRIVFNILLLTYKSLNELATAYMRDLLTPYCPSPSLRSSSQGLLVVPKSWTCTFGDTAFSISAPKMSLI